MYSLGFTESCAFGLAGECEDFATIGELFDRVREIYPCAHAKRCPDGGYLFFRDQLDLMLFERLKTDDDGSEGGMAIAQSSARKGRVKK